MNLNIWYDTWEDNLIDLGFARKKRENEDAESSLVFYDNHKDHILNLDKADGALDNTTGQRGGQLLFVFYITDVSGGASKANNILYSPTIIAGSSTAGDILPLYF